MIVHPMYADVLAFAMYKRHVQQYSCVKAKAPKSIRMERVQDSSMLQVYIWVSLPLAVGAQHLVPPLLHSGRPRGLVCTSEARVELWGP